MIKRTFEIDLTGTELYAVQEIQIDSTGGVTPCSVVAQSCYSNADIYIKTQIERINKAFGKDNVVVNFNPVKNRYTIKVSYDTEIIKDSFIIIFAITKLYL